MNKNSIAAVLIVVCLPGCIPVPAIPSFGSDAPEIFYSPTVATNSKCDQRFNIVHPKIRNVAVSLSAPRLSALDKLRVTDLPEYTEVESDAFLNAYVPQSSSSSCYAAALTSIWRAAGLKASEADFQKPIAEVCPAAKKDGASYSQIWDAAISKKLGSNVDTISFSSNQPTFGWGKVLSVDNEVAVIDGCNLIFFGLGLVAQCGPSIYELSEEEMLPDGRVLQRYSTPWWDLLTPSYERTVPKQMSVKYRLGSDVSVASQKTVVQIRSSDELLDAILGSGYLLAGLRNGESGHVVIIVGTRVSKRTGKLRSLKIMDPATPNRPTRWFSLNASDSIEELDFVLRVFP